MFDLPPARGSPQIIENVTEDEVDSFYVAGKCALFNA